MHKLMRNKLKYLKLKKPFYKKKLFFKIEFQRFFAFWSELKTQLSSDLHICVNYYVLLIKSYYFQYDMWLLNKFLFKYLNLKSRFY